MNFYQQQQLLTLKEDFKTMLTKGILWHLNCAVVVFVTTAAMTSQINEGSTLVIGIMFFAIMLTLTLAVEKLNDIFKYKGFTPWFFPYLALFGHDLIQQGTNPNILDHAIFYFSASLGVMLVDIICITLKVNQAKKEILAGNYHNTPSIETTLEADIESLKNKHNIKDITVFMD